MRGAIKGVEMSNHGRLDVQSWEVIGAIMGEEGKIDGRRGEESLEESGLTVLWEVRIAESWAYNHEMRRDL